MCIVRQTEGDLGSDRRGNGRWIIHDTRRQFLPGDKAEKSLLGNNHIDSEIV